MWLPFTESLGFYSKIKYTIIIILYPDSAHVKDN